MAKDEYVTMTKDEYVFAVGRLVGLYAESIWDLVPSAQRETRTLKILRPFDPYKSLPQGKERK